MPRGYCRLELRRSGAPLVTLWRVEQVEFLGYAGGSVIEGASKP